METNTIVKYINQRDMESLKGFVIKDNIEKIFLKNVLFNNLIKLYDAKEKEFFNEIINYSLDTIATFNKNNAYFHISFLSGSFDSIKYIDTNILNFLNEKNYIYDNDLFFLSLFKDIFKYKKYKLQINIKDLLDVIINKSSKDIGVEIIEFMFNEHKFDKTILSKYQSIGYNFNTLYFDEISFLEKFIQSHRLNKSFQKNLKILESDFGIDIKQINSNGENILHLITKDFNFKSFNNLEYLLSLNIFNINDKNNDEYTIIHNIIKNVTDLKKFKKIIDLIKMHQSIDYTIKDNCGNNYLYSYYFGDIYYHINRNFLLFLIEEMKIQNNGILISDKFLNNLITKHYKDIEFNFINNKISEFVDIDNFSDDTIKYICENKYFNLYPSTVKEIFIF